MIEKEEAKREKWTEKEISLDHPKRKHEAIRDPSIFTAGLTTNITGLHCDIAVMDDVVVQGNAYTEEGREKVREQYGYLSSIEGADAREWIVGTRYHPNDLYSDLLQKEVEKHDENGNLINRIPLFEIFGDGKPEKTRVESIGDGTGEFLWPRQQRSDGKWFGFNIEILSTKRSQYVNKTHFRAQYYNDPQDAESSPIQRSLFQYYDPAYLLQKDGRWHFKGERLNVFASIDFAFSLGKRSDSTAIVVIGVDGKQNYYILEIERFKTDAPSEYFKRILGQYQKWGFRKLRAEVSVAQQVIVKDLKESYIKPLGLSLAIEEFRPSRWQGSKEERILATLEPKYANGQIWHYPGGNCQILEEELLFTNPPHDDVKDALASAIDFAVAPVDMFRKQKANVPNFTYHSRFGGVS
jgi:phage terminase large subunit-like protein